MKWQISASLFITLGLAVLTFIIVRYFVTREDLEAIRSLVPLRKDTWTPPHP